MQLPPSTFASMGHNTHNERDDEELRTGMSVTRQQKTGVFFLNKIVFLYLFRQFFQYQLLLLFKSKNPGKIASSSGIASLNVDFFNFAMTKILITSNCKLPCKKTTFFLGGGRKPLIYRHKLQCYATLNGVLFHYLPL